MTARKKVRTFSGTHEFDPTVLLDTDADVEGNNDDIVEDIESGRCPRCQGPLPTMFPAGSRITRCRTIPICFRCGEDEGYEAMDAMAGIGYGGYSGASCWPRRGDQRAPGSVRKGDAGDTNLSLPRHNSKARRAHQLSATQASLQPLPAGSAVTGLASQ
jgi:hypothetical protein